MNHPMKSSPPEHPMFRLLKDGERIESGDQQLRFISQSADSLQWVTIKHAYEGDIACQLWHEGDWPVRRPLPFESEWVGDVTEHHGLARGYFGFWTGTGFHDFHRYTPPVNARFEDCRPFIVRIQSSGAIPANLLVWAEDESHAMQRVFDGIETCILLTPDGRSTETLSYRRARSLWEGLHNGHYTMRCKAVDWRLVLNVDWADNAGL